MTGYTRVDTANNISNGNVIDADDLDNEFNGVEAAFNASSGHTHNGTAGKGAPITLVGPAQDLIVSTSTVLPKTHNTLDLGSSSVRYKNAFLQGSITTAGAVTIATTLGVTGVATLSNNLDVTGNTTIAGVLTANGNTVIGNAATDTVTVNADVASSLIASAPNAYDLGASGSEWRNLYIDGTANIPTAAVGTANIATLNVTGNADVDCDLTVNGSINASISGVSATATALATARTITLGGDVSGAANFDGSANITITATIADDSHNHTIANVDGLQTVLDAKQATISNATTTEIGYLSGVTSAIQTQLNAKLSAVNLSSYTGDVDITGELLVDSYNETFQAVSSSSNATTINCESANVFATVLTENTTFSFTNPPASGTAYGFTLKVVQDSGASGYAITWPSSVDWPGGTAPTLTSTASAEDQLVLYTTNGGTTWYGFTAGLNLG